MSKVLEEKGVVFKNFIPYKGWKEINEVVRKKW